MNHRSRSIFLLNIIVIITDICNFSWKQFIMLSFNPIKLSSNTEIITAASTTYLSQLNTIDATVLADLDIHVAVPTSDDLPPTIEAAASFPEISGMYDLTQFNYVKIIIKM